MKDLIIAIIILLTLIAGFSQTPSEQDSAPPDTHGEGAMEQGESEITQQGKGDLPSIPEPPESPDYTELAYEVINGDWGNGSTRKRLLTGAGHDCEAVQEVVNSILKGAE